MVEAADIAQATELVRALGDKVSEMCSRLARLERQDVANRNASRETAELRCDISHAQVLIDRLQRKYLAGDNHHAQPRPTGTQALLRGAGWAQRNAGAPAKRGSSSL
jgi:hypothetical protein